MGFRPASGGVTAAGVGLYLPRYIDPPRARNKATNITTCDDIAQVRASGSTAGKQSLSTTYKGLGHRGCLKLDGPDTATGSTDHIIDLTGAPWSLGDGSTPTAYLRVWVVVADNRDPATTSANNIDLFLGTSTTLHYPTAVSGAPKAGIGKANNTEVAQKVKSRDRITCITLPAIDTADADWLPSSTTHGGWIGTFTEGAATGWADLTHVRIRIQAATPAVGSYVMPSVYLLGIERVQLPPDPILSLQFDGTFTNHLATIPELMQAYGFTGLHPIYGPVFSGNQGSSSMTLDQLHTLFDRWGAEPAVYSYWPSTFTEAQAQGANPASAAQSDWENGQNNFGGQAAAAVNPAWKGRTRAQVEEGMHRMHALMAAEGWSGSDLQCGQERKMSDRIGFQTSQTPESAAADGESLLLDNASMVRAPSTQEFPQWWPADDPGRVTSALISTTDIVAGVPTDRVKAMIRRAVKNKEWLCLHFHDIRPDASGSTIPVADFRAIMDYAIAAGRFDGTAGKIMSVREVLRLGVGS